MGPRSILAEFPLSNSMEPLRGLERPNKPAPKTDKPLTRKAVKNLKRNKRRSDKRRAKSGAPKLAPSPALEIAKTTLRKASQLEMATGRGFPTPHRGKILAPDGDGDGDGDRIQSPSGDGDGDGGQFSPVPIPDSPLC